MVYRIYVEKKPGFDGEAQGFCMSWSIWSASRI